MLISAGDMAALDPPLPVPYLEVSWTGGEAGETGETGSLPFRLPLTLSTTGLVTNSILFC